MEPTRGKHDPLSHRVPGTGKLTIGQEIRDREWGFRLVHNHLINAPLYSVIPLDGVTSIPQRVWGNQTKIWEAVLDTMIHVSPPEFSFILTNYLSQNDPDAHAWFAKVADMATERGAWFVPVLLRIEPEEHARRIVNEDRRERMKQTDPSAGAIWVSASIDHN